ncbi:two-component system phosphate regulon response regulator PhoB/two-component system alkaline phosphatase synthesis response regulator PhoP [Mucilaginibacter oryzae]|uniref:Two-component system phosphate regulon response regulator PhoB/two-component system alkaline phosphatase synthesis response regulator PhoP n=1 Tax=Mucilaginibacter oryzae TaxID=468058 RepID=A0A316HEE7_9SPHI|nr:response regulator transcription factor [Mucilaginibacter oryzae]PWK78401.1 two-component system phosphate regulon response regulator PhoB/two-component system alkaline phosphatase synthesis response regulator PhoP [Mucilaginibacter oryzae]
MRKPRLVIIDDHYDILEILKHNMVQEGYEVKMFFNAVDALKYINADNTDLLVTDWMLPEMDGLELCRNLKMSPSTRDIPLVMLTGKNDEIDAVTALEVGAEDYMTKPIRMRELMSRVKKILRRKSTEDTASTRKEAKEIIECGVLRMNLVSYKVYINNELLELTIGEFKLLELLAKQPGKVFSRSQIIERINGSQYFATERSIDVQIAGLRKKLGEYKDAVETVRSVGYRFNERFV